MNHGYSVATKRGARAWGRTVFSDTAHALRTNRTRTVLPKPPGPPAREDARGTAWAPPAAARGPHALSRGGAEFSARKSRRPPSPPSEAVNKIHSASGRGGRSRRRASGDFAPRGSGSVWTERCPDPGVGGATQQRPRPEARAAASEPPPPGMFTCSSWEQVCSPAPCAPGRGEPRRALGGHLSSDQLARVAPAPILVFCFLSFFLAFSGV